MDEVSKICRTCGKDKPLTEFRKCKTWWEHQCKACNTVASKLNREQNRHRVRQSKKQWYYKNREDILKREREKNLWVKRSRLKLGVTPEAYDQMVSDQQGLCAICHLPPQRNSLSLDHDHVTGYIRGLLCHNCNLLLGNAKDSVSTLISAIAYLDLAKEATNART